MNEFIANRNLTGVLMDASGVVLKEPGSAVNAPNAILNETAVAVIKTAAIANVFVADQSEIIGNVSVVVRWLFEVPFV